MEPPKRLPFLLTAQCLRGLQCHVVRSILLQTNQRGIVFSLGPMAVLPRGTFAFLNIAESLRSMQRLAGRPDASPCGLIRENAAHDKAAPALARKRISLRSCQTLLLFGRLLHMLSIARP